MSPVWLVHGTYWFILNGKLVGWEPTMTELIPSHGWDKPDTDIITSMDFNYPKFRVEAVPSEIYEFVYQDLCVPEGL